MIYSEENIKHKLGTIFLVLAVLCVYVLPMGIAPVRESEARLAFMANRCTWDSTGKMENFLHEKSPCMLLQRGFYRLMTRGGTETEASLLAQSHGRQGGRVLPALAPRRALWASRLVALLALLCLILPCILTVKREMSGPAAMVSAAVIIGALPVMALSHISLRAVFLAGLINAAWFTWYFLARQRKSWDQAWAAAGLFLLIACLEGGSLMLVVFYFPLVFLRRPFRIWQRMLNPVHLVTLGAILIFSIFWSHFSQSDEGFQLMRHVSADGAGGGGLSYLLRFVILPFGFIVILIPWVMIIWPAYCAAFKTAEKNAVFAHFLRTLIAPICLVAWLVAHMKPLPVLLVVPPLAALAALHYDLLVRRHIGRLRRCARGFRRLIYAAGGVLLLCWLAHAIGLPRFAGVKLSTAAWALFFLALAIGWCRLGRFNRNRFPFWVELLHIAVALGCLGQSVSLPLGDFFNRDAAADAAELMARVPAEAPVYVLPQGGAITSAFYSRQPLIEIPSPDRIPEKAKVVYVWADGRPPLLETRLWEAVSNRLPRKRGKTFTLSKSTDGSRYRLFTFVCGWSPVASRTEVNCIYRGLLDPESERLLTP